MEIPQNCEPDSKLRTGVQESTAIEILKESVKLPQSFNVKIKYLPSSYIQD